MVGPSDKIFLHDGMPDNVWRVDSNRNYSISSINRSGAGGMTKLVFDSAHAPPANLSSVGFRIGYLPPAIKITLQATDEARKNVRTFERIFTLKAR